MTDTLFHIAKARASKIRRLAILRKDELIIIYALFHIWASKIRRIHPFPKFHSVLHDLRGFLKSSNIYNWFF